MFSGVGVTTYPLATDMIASRRQSSLERELAGAGESYGERSVKQGRALTKLEVPRLGIDVVVVEGTTPDVLRAGAGHYAGTALPGDEGNVSIAGHRTTYGAPFNRIDELLPGDRILLTTPAQRHEYRVIALPWVVEPADWSPIRDYPAGVSFLTLTSCTPEGSDDERVVVRAILFDPRPIPRSTDFSPTLSEMPERRR